MIGESVIKTFDDVIQGFNSYLGLSLHHYCKLETVETQNNYTIVSDNGSLCTIIGVEGSMEGRGEKDYEESAKSQSKVLHTKFSYSGHLLQIVFDYNPSISDSLVSGLLEPSKKTAKRLNFEMDNLYDDWGEAISKYCADEKIYFVLWTKPDILSPRDRGKAHRKMRKKANIDAPPTTRHTQNIAMTMEDLLHQHESFISMVNDGFKTLGIVTKTYSATAALRSIRKIIDYDFTEKNWRPVLPGDKLVVRIPEYAGSNNVADSFLYPSLQQQLFPREPITVRKAVEIGDKYHQGILLSLPPQREESFMSLFSKMKDKEMPWRASFFIEPNGFKYVQFKSVMAQILQYKNSSNQRFNRAIKGLEKQHNECIVRLRGSFSTWVKIDAPNAISLLSQQINKLSTAVQSWGSCDVSEMIGDPMLGVAASIPGLMLSHPSPNAAAPLTKVLYMMPMSRPASPWDSGSMLLRSPDGKVIPFHPQSSKQSAWVDIGVAPMGGGKSVFLNSINFAFIFQPGMSELPYLTIIDIGPSSKGLITLLRAQLPPEKKYLAICKRLKMTPEYSINPFDTPLGSRHPLVAQKSYLVNFLSLLATPLNKTASQDGVTGLASTIIDMAYNQYSDEGSPRNYERGDNRQITLFLEEHADELADVSSFKIDEHTTWWEITDALFLAGYITEAISAQRYAVPRLEEVASFVTNEIVLSQYNFLSESQQPITEFFHRQMVESIEKYPILKRPTQFDIGSARIVSIDLDEVAPRGGDMADRQTAVMYMLARHVGASKFFLMPTDVDQMNSTYKAYHQKEIASIRKNPKRLAYDETHRVFRNSAISQQTAADLETAIRESRKWNLSIGLYSQTIKDYPEEMIELATQKFIFGAGDEKSIGVLQERFALSDVTTDRLRHLGKPGPKGSNIICIMNTSEGKFEQELTNTLGPQALWAFSSTSEDCIVRDELYERIGVQKTLSILGQSYPGGIKKEVERRREIFSLTDSREAVDIIDTLTNEIHKKALEREI